ncbi:hypothetical protein ACIQPP_19595 [Streptomyces violaceusniger]|nr:hypothetical protein [Streptomyces hygroscopicus]AQW50729.1 hypothetical protein SHXM_04192 [Streptomyces hygroscopicus]
MREILLQAVRQTNAWPDVFALVAAGVESRAADLGVEEHPCQIVR